MTDIVEAVVAFLAVAGAAFALLGSIGLVRFPDFYSRMHGPSKATTLGLTCLLLAALVHFAAHGSLSFHEIVFVLFVVITTPVSAHLLGRAARHRGLPEVSTGAGMERPRNERGEPDDAKRRDVLQPTHTQDPDDDERDRELDRELKETFPASDPSPPKHVD